MAAQTSESSANDETVTVNANGNNTHDTNDVTQEDDVIYMTTASQFNRLRREANTESEFWKKKTFPT